jgi:hypothetical protein
MKTKRHMEYNNFKRCYLITVYSVQTTQDNLASQTRSSVWERVTPEDAATVSSKSTIIAISEMRQRRENAAIPTFIFTAKTLEV